MCCLIEYDFEVVVDGGRLLASSIDMRRIDCGHANYYDSLPGSVRDAGECGDICEGLGPLATVGATGG